MVDVEADQGGAAIERKTHADRIDRDRRQPPADRQITEDDHQCRWHEGAEQHTVHDAERNQRRVIVDKPNCQLDYGIDQARNAEHAAQAEYSRKPHHRRCDEDSASQSRQSRAARLRQIRAKTRREGQATPPTSGGYQNWPKTSQAAPRRPQTAAAARYHRARSVRDRYVHFPPFATAPPVLIL